jgi:hydroxymethylglutaryl-CoA lyase
VAEYVRITEVSPRDGLQNEPEPIPTEEKLRLIRALVCSGVDEIEVTSFVSPRWVPQLADGAEVLEAAAACKPDGMVFSALVPNERGLERALAVNARARALDKIAVFTAASETFSRKNTNGSIDETLARFGPVIDEARRAGLLVRAYISCAFGCPFEGPVSPDAVVRLAARLYALGADEIDLGDTIGMATPSAVEWLAGVLYDRVGPCHETDIGEPCLTLHFHDTHGRAAECVRAGLAAGVRSFDGSAAGLGGCPYASVGGRRAPGNIATRTLVETIAACGYGTGVRPGTLAEAERVARALAPAGGAA